MPDDRIQYDEHPDVIEKRRLERVEKALHDGKRTDNITGESTTNFVSVLIHHRKPDVSHLKSFESIATRWTRAN